MCGGPHTKNFNCVGDHTKIKKNFEKIKNKKFEKNFNYNVM